MKFLNTSNPEWKFSSYPLNIHGLLPSAASCGKVLRSSAKPLPLVSNLACTDFIGCPQFLYWKIKSREVSTGILHGSLQVTLWFCVSLGALAAQQVHKLPLNTLSVKMGPSPSEELTFGVFNLLGCVDPVDRCAFSEQSATGEAVFFFCFGSLV